MTAADRVDFGRVVSGRIAGLMLIVAAIATIQLGAALSVDQFAATGPSGTTWLRLCWASLVFLIVGRPRLSGRPLRDYRLIVALGTVTAVMSFSIYEAFARIPQGVAVAIEVQGPLAVALLGSRRPRDLAWVALAALGVALLIGRPGSVADAGDGAAIDPLGVGFAALAGCGWGGYIMLTARVGRVFRGVQALGLSFGVAAVLGAPLGLAQAASALTTVNLLRCLGLALLIPILPYAVEMSALRRVPAHVFGILMCLEPGIAALFGLVVLGQRLALLQSAGLAAVAIASLGAVWFSRKTAIHA